MGIMVSATAGAQEPTPSHGPNASQQAMLQGEYGMSIHFGPNTSQDVERPDGTAPIFRIRADRPAQTIRHFGASDAWSFRYIGSWPEGQQRQIARWLFSTENDSTGQPLGIGLSLWRFNLGAGSAEQGDSSFINEGTRTECVLRRDGSYDWSRQGAQRRFMRYAKEEGLPFVLAFMNSVPVYYTANGLATNTGRGGTMNIRQGGEKDVARYVATALEGIGKRDGVHIDYISPVNEPDGSWNWQGPKQEGSPATTAETARLVRAISKALLDRGLDTRITVNESSDLRAMTGRHQSEDSRCHAISAFFDRRNKATYIGGLSNVEHAMLGHSYWSDTPVDTMRAVRMRVRDSLRTRGISYWQSELCIMSNDGEIGKGQLFDFSMRTALYVARVMHYDLVFGNAESWSWWRAAGGDYKDGLLRVFSDDGMRTGRALPSRLMWVMGNYSRFIRPGAVRLCMEARRSDGTVIPEGDTDPRGLMVSAYRNTDGRRVIVAVNYSEGQRELRLDDEATWTMYRTSDAEGECLKPVGTMNGHTTLPPRSVTTMVAVQGMAFHGLK